MTKRRAPAPILSQSFVWIPSACHDASSEAFRERQRERIARMQAKPAAPAVNVAKLRKVAT
jgi:hypothetical protein